MNRTEAFAIADKVETLRKLEALKTDVDATSAKLVVLAGDAGSLLSAIGTEHPAIVAAARSAISSAAQSLIVDLKAELGISEDPAPVAEAATAEATAAEAGPATTEAEAGEPAVAVGTLTEAEPVTAIEGAGEPAPASADPAWADAAPSDVAA